MEFLFLTKIKKKMSGFMHAFSFTYKLFIALILLIVTFILALTFGAADLDMAKVFHAFFSHKTNESFNIFREIRLPREIGAVLVGAALSVSGAIIQGLTRNPLADPGLLGLTAGANAALAVTMAFVPTASYLWLTVACFIGAAAGGLMVFGIGAVKKSLFSPVRMVLAGVAITAFLEAIAQGVALTFKISKDVSMWTAGGLVGTTWHQLQIITPIILIGLFLAVALSRQLTILSLNEEVAIAVGQKTLQIKILLLIIVIILTGCAVALVGNMAFIGLMIPHLVRPFVGTDYRFVIPISALFGASFMSLADLLGRTIHAPYETPVAAIITILGLPFFLYVVRKGGQLRS